MNSQVVLRLLDTFFRHLWLYLVPVVLFGAVGLWTVTSSEDSYQSVGTMKIEPNARVAELTGSQQDLGFGWESPAAATAGSINALLRTSTFVDKVAVTARLEDELEAGAITGDQIRGSIAVYPDGARLVKVVGSNQFPDVAHSLANSVLASYIDTVTANEASDSEVAKEFLEQKLPDYQAAVADAEKALDDWIAANPPPEGDDPRPENELVELEKLQATIVLRNQSLNEAEAAIEQAELSIEQKEAEVRQRLEVIDPPQEPFAPQPKLRKAVMTVAMALVVGCILSLVGVVIGTILDRTIRFPGDVKQRLDTRVLAVVPRARLSAGMRKRLETGTEDAPEVAAVEQHEPEVPRSAPTPAVPIGFVEETAAVPAPPSEAPQTARRKANGARASVTLKRVP